MNLRRLYHNSFLLPAIIAFTYFCLLLETIKYPGFIGNHFYIGAEVYFAISIVLLLFTDAENKNLNIIFKINKLILPVVFVAYFVLNLVEGAHYTNYVLNIYKLHLDGMVYIFLFSLLIFLIGENKENINLPSKNRGIYYPFVFFLALFVSSNLPYSLDMAMTKNSYILFHCRNTYDEKMAYQWPVFYNFMVFVKNNTPENATIIIPPMGNPWLMGSGNPHFVRAFLYPRNIIQETAMIAENNLLTFPHNTYILISWGKEACIPDPDCHGWPRQKIEAQKVIYKDPDSTGAIEVRENTVYDPGDKEYVYGIIKL